MKKNFLLGGEKTFCGRPTAPPPGFIPPRKEICARSQRNLTPGNFFLTAPFLPPVLGNGALPKPGLTNSSPIGEEFPGEPRIWPRRPRDVGKNPSPLPFGTQKEPFFPRPDGPAPTNPPGQPDPQTHSARAFLIRFNGMTHVPLLPQSNGWHKSPPSKSASARTRLISPDAHRIVWATFGSINGVQIAQCHRLHHAAGTSSTDVKKASFRAKRNFIKREKREKLLQI